MSDGEVSESTESLPTPQSSPEPSTLESRTMRHAQTRPSFGRSNSANFVSQSTHLPAGMGSGAFSLPAHLAPAQDNTRLIPPGYSQIPQSPLYEQQGSVGREFQHPPQHQYAAAGSELEVPMHATPHHLLAAAQVLRASSEHGPDLSQSPANGAHMVQSSPGALSSGSSATSEQVHPHGMYYVHVQNNMPEVNYYVQDANMPPHYHGIQAPSNLIQSRPQQTGPQMSIPPPQDYGVQQHQQPQMWYDTMPYHPPMAVAPGLPPTAQPRSILSTRNNSEWWIKEEEDDSIPLPSKRASIF
ncbi:hypothetical protein L228DRAFT_56665 [Xylona heveae TC161]|uniref:Uncharacterized protein n=1 Tax=Xylona heveae (strain CBS 132557 / TC161) TaxID=1328760 RepID=A0A165IFP7_XYLHT|nr:hypothetical protein L228DRAFT_56665 [Xylona heveae TC161]KZF24829.1 hypothetical protein L228DRAFT_56665 [Xylona heveae TC161]